MACHTAWVVRCNCCGKYLPGNFTWKQQGIDAAEKAGWWVVSTKTICPRCSHSVQKCSECDGTSFRLGLPCTTCQGRGIVLKPGSPIDRMVKSGILKEAQNGRP